MARTRHSARLSVENLEGRITPAAGALDTTFGINGLVSFSVPQPGVASPTITAQSSVVQSDGKIVVVGTVGPSTVGTNQYLSGLPSPDFAVVRFNANGSLDTTFGKNGLARIPFDIGPADKSDQANTVGIQSDGRIVIAGQAAQMGPAPLSTFQWAVTRLNTDGSLDTTFGTNGLVEFPFTGGGVLSYPTDMAITANDDIIIVGRQDKAGDPSGFEVVRLLPRGQFDPGFGAGGQLTLTNPTPLTGGATSIRGNGSPDALTVAPDGSIFLAGPLQNRAGDYSVAKISAGGSLDTSFGVLNAAGTAHTGFAFANLNPIDPSTGLPGTFQGLPTDVAVDANGKILVTGVGSGNFVTVRFTASGVLDTTFGTSGVSTVAFNLGGVNQDTAESIAIQPDGKIVLGGEAQISGTGVNNTTPPAGPQFYFAAARLTTTGTLDTTFGTGGKVNYSVNDPAGDGPLVGAHSLIFTTGGKILLVGNDSQRVAMVQMQNNVTFNPLPASPAPPPTSPPPVASPGTNISAIGVAGDGPLLIQEQNPDAQTHQYNPKIASNIGALGALQFLAQGFTGVIRSAIGDVNGDNIPDIAVVTGPGTPTRWAVINGANPNAFLIPPSVAFRGSEQFDGGGFVSVGDFDGDGKDEIVISADQGGGPRITIYSYVPSQPSAPTVDANFFGIADQNFTGGVRTAVGDINGDGVPDLAVAAGIGGGPRIALYNGLTLFTNQTKLTNDFYAFDSSLRDGAYVAIGDVNGDGFGDLIFGAGDGGAPEVLVANGQKLLENPGTGISSPLNSFYVGGDSLSRGGVRVAAKDVDGDNKADIVTGSGEGQESTIHIYRGSSTNKGEPNLQQVIDPFNLVMTDGVYVG